MHREIPPCLRLTTEADPTIAAAGAVGVLMIATVGRSDQHNAGMSSHTTPLHEEDLDADPLLSLIHI